jgi:hypothetical protein
MSRVSRWLGDILGFRLRPLRKLVRAAGLTAEGDMRDRVFFRVPHGGEGFPACLARTGGRDTVCVLGRIAVAAPLHLDMADLAQTFNADQKHPFVYGFLSRPDGFRHVVSWTEPAGRMTPATLRAALPELARRVARGDRFVLDMDELPTKEPSDSTGAEPRRRWPVPATPLLPHPEDRSMTLLLRFTDWFKSVFHALEPCRGSPFEPVVVPSVRHGGWTVEHADAGRVEFTHFGLGTGYAVDISSLPGDRARITVAGNRPVSDGIIKDVEQWIEERRQQDHEPFVCELLPGNPRYHRIHTTQSLDWFARGGLSAVLTTMAAHCHELDERIRKLDDPQRRIAGRRQGDAWD